MMPFNFELYREQSERGVFYVRFEFPEVETPEGKGEMEMCKQKEVVNSKVEMMRKDGVDARFMWN